MRCIRSLPYRDVLDAGCGNGDFAVYLSQRFPGANIVGIDADGDVLRQSREFSARKRLKNISFQAVDLRQLSAKDAYDLIYSIEVLQYIPRNKSVVSNFFSALRPGGLVFVHMLGKDWDNKYFFDSRRFTTYNAERPFLVGEKYSLDELVRIFRDEGFRVVHARKTFGFFGRLAWELDQITAKRGLVRALLLPLIKSIGVLDVLPSRNGCGCLVLARKEVS